MTTAVDIKAGDSVKFSIHGSMGSKKNFEGEVAGIVIGRFVPTIFNPRENHVNIYPTLPEEKKIVYLDDYSSYMYIHLVEPDGSAFYIGLPWVIDETIAYPSRTRLNLQLNNYDESRQQELFGLLAQHGFEIGSATIVRN